MAPIRSRARSRAVNAGRKAGSMNNKLDVADRIPDSKSDKRRIKHSLLVAKAQASARVQKPALKRRRPAKKLRAAEDLENLVASLPEVAKKQSGDIQNGKRSNSGRSGGALASKAGVQKRRDAIARQEQERFSKNLANINTQSKSQGTNEGTSHWLALRQHTHTRHESTTTAPASAAAAPVSSSEPPTSLTWNDFFRLRQRRRYINVGASALTASASLITGVGVIAAQDLEALQIFGLDPMIAGGIACLVCAGAGWLMGPLLGTVAFRLFVGRMSEMGAKERDFYGRIRRYRVDPSNSSMQNPVPDYYGEKITSVRGYRQWLKDQKAFRRKRESLM
ncbi:MAG: hypothetical protein Q9162_006900 [Coniocarpon cinnabarinum]